MGHGPGAVGKPFPVVQSWMGFPTGPTDFSVFRAELTGLTPGTEYEFRIGTMSPAYRFRTMPAKATKAFTFVSGGDCGVNLHAINNNKAAAKQDPMFALIGGDLGYDNGKSGDTAIQFIRNYSRTMTDSQGRLIPMVTCIGNHEVAGSYGKTRRKAPSSSRSSTVCTRRPATRRSTSATTSAWSCSIRDTPRRSAASRRSGWTGPRRSRLAPHLIAVNHVPCYPSYRVPEGKGGKFGTGEEQRKNWVPLFDKHNIDLVLEHHDHTFKRTIRCAAARWMRGPALSIWAMARGASSASPICRRSGPTWPRRARFSHMTLHRLEGERSFHLALNEDGKILDICHTGKKPRYRARPGANPST